MKTLTTSFIGDFSFGKKPEVTKNQTYIEWWQTWEDAMLYHEEWVVKLFGMVGYVPGSS